MGWANCGEDSKGRPIGYAHMANCDFRKGEETLNARTEICNARIDRGLSYACGGMHGEDVYSCEGYFCQSHLHYVGTPDRGSSMQICSKCYDFLAEEGFLDDEDDIVDEPREEFKRISVSPIRASTLTATTAKE